MVGTPPSGDKGFILTMWYVNCDLTEEEKMEIECFILTMWYVNMSDKWYAAYFISVLY